MGNDNTMAHCNHIKLNGHQILGPSHNPAINIIKITNVFYSYVLNGSRNLKSVLAIFQLKTSSSRGL